DSARWLVLGAKGFVGSTMIAILAARGCQIFGAIRSVPSPGAVAGKSWHAIDVFNADNLRALLRKLRPSILLNAVGHSPAIASADLKDFYVRSTKTILEAVKAEQPACRVVLLGSAAEYGNSPEAGSFETDAPRPLSDYGRAKCEQFEISRRFAANGLDVITARLFNVIGPGQDSHQFVAALLERIHRGERPLCVHSGNHVRDWIDVRDVARALVILAELPEPSAVVNVCTGKGRTVEFVAGIIGRLTGAKIKTELREISPNVLWRSIGNPERMFDLGWRPRYNLAESLADQWRFSCEAETPQ
ncbi:MAG TPA: NAD(P)-dependent oxidoreductase, partial [Candidatus Baltobacteraceae bacterium]|nr:NAD(P)-dependent oxidoreductase [Candidatus Baltobacteraceae bacterium]